MKVSKMILPVAVAATGFAAAGVGLASADTVDTSSTTTSSSTTSTDKPPTGAPSDNDPQKKDGGVITTDADVVSAVTTAVNAQNAGSTVDRIAKLPDGSYLAFTRKSDDSKLIVSLDSSYSVTANKDVPAGAPSGRGAPSGSTSSSTES